MNAQDRELYDAIIGVYYAFDPLFRPETRWVMDAAWLQRLKDMRDDKGDKLWDEHATHLLGKPWVIRPDGGFPHLEVIPVEVPPAMPHLA